MKYVIGVDAGGTGTAAAAYALDGGLLCSTETGPGNVTAGGAEAEENILNAVRYCLNAAGDGCARIVVGMAGLDESHTPWRMRARLGGLSPAEADVMPDGLLALYAAHSGGDGLLVVSGTGSVAYGKRGAQTLRRGGWGHILGDEGSGYAIAVEAIRLALADLDGGLPEHGLTAALLDAAGCDRLRCLVERVYTRPKHETARLSEAVAEESGRGDARACRILTRAGEALADLAVALNAQLGLETPHIALAGGIFENVRAAREAFERRVLREMRGAVIEGDIGEPLKGALYIYREKEANTSHAD